MLVLGIDTSNYASCLAVYCTQTNKFLYKTKKILPVKKGNLGLRQSDAVFHHTVALPDMMQEMAKLVDLTKVVAVGVSCKPEPLQGSYMPCFLVGQNAATYFCAAKNIPLIKTTHQQGHVMSAIYKTGDETLHDKPLLVFHVSGGTTKLLYCKDINNIKIIGETKDLYAGQAVDRIGVKLGFSFPAGEYMSKIALTCNDDIDPKISVKDTMCNLSGLENKCNELISDNKSDAYVAKYCLTAIAKTVLHVIKNAKKTYINEPIVCAGGVMSSEVIKQYVQKQMPQIKFVSGEFSSDNAMGVALIAARQYNKNI